MKISKLIFALILFCVIAFQNTEVKAQDVQEILFAVGDTVETVDIPGDDYRVFITIADSSVAGTDSITALAVTKSTRSLYSPVAVHDINATALTTYLAQPMVPTDGLTKTYSFEASQVPSGQFLIYRNNTTSQAGRCRISVTFKRK